MTGQNCKIDTKKSLQANLMEMKLKGLMKKEVKKKRIIVVQSQLMMKNLKESINSALKDQFEEEEDTFQMEKD